MTLKEIGSNGTKLQAREQYRCIPPDIVSAAISIGITEVADVCGICEMRNH